MIKEEYKQPKQSDLDTWINSYGTQKPKGPKRMTRPLPHKDYI